VVGLDAGTKLVIIIAAGMLLISGLFFIASRIALWLDPDDSTRPTWKPDGYQVQYDHKVPVGIAWIKDPRKVRL